MKFPIAVRVLPLEHNRPIVLRTINLLFLEHLVGYISQSPQLKKPSTCIIPVFRFNEK